MIGRRVESRPGPRWGSLLLLFGGLALGAAGLALRSAPAAIASLLPIALGGTTWLLGRERRFAATLTAEAIELEHPPGRVPYASLRNLWAGGHPHDPATFRKRSAPIVVEHDEGVIRIPRQLDVPSADVYRFLAGQITASGRRDVGPVLLDYLERAVARHGPEAVWTYRASERRVRRENRRALAFGLGLLLGGLAWIAAGAAVGSEDWQGGGVSVAVFGGVVLLVSALGSVTSPRAAIRNWKASSLVIGPEGMAMVQGDVEGVIRWPELLDVRFIPRSRSFRLSRSDATAGIRLRVKGADIVIADIYDRPLSMIYQRILAASGRAAPNAPCT